MTVNIPLVLPNTVSINFSLKQNETCISYSYAPGHVIWTSLHYANSEAKDDGTLNELARNAFSVVYRLPMIANCLPLFELFVACIRIFVTLPSFLTRKKMGKIAKAYLQTVVGKATSLRTYDGVYFLLRRSSKRLFGVSWQARSFSFCAFTYFAQRKSKNAPSSL